MRHRQLNTNVIQNTASAKFRTFCKHSTLHGLYYFSEKRSWMVYTVWTAIIISSLTLCLFLSQMIWAKFVKDPTFTVVETTHYSTTQIPFPAVTVCDTELVYGPNTINITNILQYRSFNQDQISDFYESFTNIKEKEYTPPDHVKKMHKVLHDLGYTYKVLLETLMKPCDVLMVQCSWRSNVHNCTDMFRMVYTVVGYCCQFDMQFFRSKTELLLTPKSCLLYDGARLPRRQWYSRTATEHSRATQSYLLKLEHADPSTNFVAGVEMSDALGITVNGQRTAFTDTVSEGYVSLYVYDADTRITTLDYPATLPPYGLFDVSVHVWAADTTDDVKALAMQTRQCFVASESSIEGYTHQECMSIHVLRKVVEYCRCLPFNYSAKTLQVDNDFPTCVWERLICIHQTLQKVKSEIKDILYRNHCLQRCDYVHYATDIEFVQYQRKTKSTNESFSNVVVHFSSSTCMKYKKQVIYSWDQMMANLGGIFGLCFGGSIISLIEIIWFAVDFILTPLKVRYTRTNRKTHVFTITKKDVSSKVKKDVEGKFKFVH